MEDLLGSTGKCGEEWSLRFSGRKYKAMEFSSRGKGQWVLANNILEITYEYKYTTLALEVSWEEIGGKTNKA